MESVSKAFSGLIVAVAVVVAVNLFGSALDKLTERPETPVALVEMPDAPDAAPVELTPGDVARGVKVAKACAACHSFDPAGSHKVGPKLAGVFGTPIASQAGFKYSEALRGVGGTWSEETLNAWLTNPKEFAPGTKMSYRGLQDEQKRRDIIADLESLAP